MSTDLEERLRRDLPRLAAQLADEPLADPVPERRRQRRLPIAAAAVVALMVGVVALVVTSGDDTPDVVVVDGDASASVVSVFDGGWIPILDAPLRERSRPVVADLGDRAFVWGGHADLLALQSGAMFDGDSLTWTPTPDNSWAHPGGTGAWTGEVVVVLAKNGGATFDPETGDWSDLPQIEDFRSGLREAHWDGQRVVALGWATELTTGMSTAQVAMLDPATNTWTSGAVLHGTLDVDLTQGALVGSSPVVWDGATSRGWIYDSRNDGWAELSALVTPGGADVDRSTIHDVNGEMVVVASVGGDIRAAVLRDGDWRWFDQVLDNLQLEGRLTSDGPGAAVLARAAGGRAAVVVATADEVRELPGAPLQPVADPGAVWLDDGLFVWGGDADDGPTDRGAFWRFRHAAVAATVDSNGEAALPAVFDRPRDAADEMDATEQEIFENTSFDSDRSRRVVASDTAAVSIVPGRDDRSFCLHLSIAGGGGAGCAPTAEVVTAGWFGLATEDVVAGVVAPDVEAVRIGGRTIAVHDQIFVAESPGGLDVELVRQPQRAAVVAACDALAAVGEAMNRLEAPAPATLESLRVAALDTDDAGLRSLVDHLGEAEDPLGMSDDAAGAFTTAGAVCRAQLVPGWAVVYTPPVATSLQVDQPRRDLAELGAVQVQRASGARLSSATGFALGPIVRFEVEGQAVFVWSEGTGSQCVGFRFDLGGFAGQCGTSTEQVITEPIPDGSGRSIHLWPRREASSRVVTMEVAGQRFVQETLGGYAAFVADDGAPRFDVIDD